MRSKRLSTLFLCAVCLLLAGFSRAQAVTHMQPTGQGFPMVQVSINGSGPYAFFLDTGSNRTLVRQELLANLGVASGTAVPAHMATGASYVRPAVVSSVAVAGLTVHQLEIEAIDGDRLSRLDRTFQGVLGEDFLKHFDVLIDNGAKTLTLDPTSGLAQSLAGDRLPLSFSGVRAGRPTTGRLVFDVKLPYSAETAHFLIDSGASHTIVFSAEPLPLQSHIAPGGTLHTFGGSARCHTGVAPLAIGKYTLPALDLAYCEGMRSNMDVDGVLATNTFKRLFISHSGAYAIANPRLRKSHAGSF